MFSILPYDPFALGMHRFVSPMTRLTLEYIVYHPVGEDTDDLHRNLIVVQCPGWGVGSPYLQHGLSDLWAPAPTDSNNTSPAVYTVVFLHPRGTGASGPVTWSHGLSTMPDMCSDLEDLRVHLRVEKIPVLLGHSNGGAIALGYAELYPDRVQKLILVQNQIIGMGDRQNDKIEAMRQDPRYGRALDNLAGRYADTDEGLTESVNALWPLYFYDPARYIDEFLYAVGDQKFSVFTYRYQAHCDENLPNPTQMIDGLKYIRAPTLVIFGEDDMIIGLKVARRTKEGIPGAKLITYKECGHFPWVEQKESFMKDVRQFIEGSET